MRTQTLAALALLAFATVRAEAAEQRPEASLSGTAGTGVVSTAPNQPTPLNEQDLAGISGGESFKIEVLTNQNLNAAVNGNSLNAGTIESGAVSLSAGALNGFNGIGNFVINTGNNNVLQGSLSVTVITAPSP